MNISKMLLFALALGIAATSFLVCGNVFAQEEKPTQSQLIQNSVNKIEGVNDCRVFAYEDCVIVAVRTSGIYLKTFESQLEEKIKKQLEADFPQYKNVKITMSLKIFKAIDQLNHLIETGEVNPEEFFKRKKPKIHCPDRDNDTPKHDETQPKLKEQN